MRIVVVATAICLSIVGLSVAADVEAAMRKPVNIPAQELASALQALAKDRDFQLVYHSDLIGRRRTAGAVGELTTEEALTQLLNGTGLTYRYLGDKAITIMPFVDTTGSATHESSGTSPQTGDKTSRGASSSTQEGKKSSSSGFRVAQVDQGADSQPSTVGSNTSSTPERSNKVGLEEVVVTAQKREERVFDVPISIVALSADELEKRQIHMVDDLTLRVPGLSIQSSGGTRRIYIDGVSNIGGSNSLTAGMYVDEADITGYSVSQPDVSVYDLERVEVLRGPQGTLFGDGAIGGIVRFISKNPALDKFTFDADTATSFTQGGAPGQRVDAVVNVPLITDKLALRIAGSVDHEGGWIDQPAANVKDFNSQNRTDVRAKVLWLPTDQLTINAMAMIHRNTFGQTIGENASGNYTQEFGLMTTPNEKDDSDIYNVTGTYDLAGIRLLSATTYIDEDEQRNNEGFVLPINAGGPAFEVIFNPQETKVHSVSEELRLSSTGSASWQWTLGGYYKDLKTSNSGVELFGLPGPPPAPSQFIQCCIVDESRAVFADTSYEISDSLALGVGGRYYWDSVNAGETSYGAGFSPDGAGKFHSFDPRFYIKYKATEEINLYASAAKGFRSGGFNLVDQPTFGPESVWRYELGSKAALLDGRLNADISVFYSRYLNYQMAGIVSRPPAPPLGITSNAGDAWIKGVEWDLTWHPADPWTLSFNGNVIDTRFYKVTVTDGEYNVGDHLDWIPKYKITASAQRDFTWNDRKGFIRLDYSRQGRETFLDRQYLPPPSLFFSQSDIINMLDFNGGLRLSHNLSVGAFARNLLNDRGFTDAYDILHQAPRSRPRTFGVQFSVKFD